MFVGRRSMANIPRIKVQVRADPQVVICIVSDGRTKINPRTRSVLAALGVYQDGVAQSVFLDKPVVCAKTT